MAGIIEVKDQGKLRIYDADNSHYTDIVVPSSVTANRTITLPDASFTVPNISGITMADQWRLTANITSNGDITSNLERVDNTSYGKIGTGMSQSSGIFTFPSTGLYKINFNMQGFAQADDNVLGYIYTTTNNSSYNADAIGYFCGDGSTQGSASALAEYFFNVTNTSTHKIKFNLTSIASTTSGVFGSTTINNTCFTFIRLGDSV